MRSGFELFKARPLSDPIDLESLERQYELILPPKFKMFAQTFYLGENQILREQFFDKANNDYFDCSAYVYAPNPDVGFSHFNDLKKSFETWNSRGLSDLAYKKNFFPIGSGNYDGIFVGLDSDNQDKILLLGYGLNSFEIVSKDIFDFVRGIEIRNLTEDFLMGTKYSQLYKNWGENFWRVRD